MKKHGETVCERCGRKLLHGRHLNNEPCVRIDVVLPEENTETALAALREVFGDSVALIRETPTSRTYALTEQPSKLQIVEPKKRRA